MEDFKHWLDANRGATVSEVFHDVIAKVAELEAKLEKYENLEPVAYVVNAEIRWNTDKIPAFVSLYALEMK